MREKPPLIPEQVKDFVIALAVAVLLIKLLMACWGAR